MKPKFGEDQIARRVDIFTAAFVLFFIISALAYIFTAYFPVGTKTLTAKPAVTSEKKVPACCADKNSKAGEAGKSVSRKLPEKKE